MKCPNCNETLLMTERQGVEIDYCPACRGVWLDKGELDKLLDYASAPQRETRNEPYGQSFSDKYSGQGSYKDDRKSQHPHKKKSFLSDFFDFD